MNYDLIIIPGGMTKVLQPLDVLVNTPMKDAIRNKLELLDADRREHMYTTGSNMRKHIHQVTQ